VGERELPGDVRVGFKQLEGSVVMTRGGPKPSRSIDGLLDQIDELHSYPPIVQQILAETRDDDFDIRRVVACVQRDPALASSILRLVNSSYFGLANKVASVQHAMTYLGRRTLRLAVLSFGLVDRLVKATPAQLFEDYWRRELTIACAARRCAKGTEEDADTAYSAGLFADLGVLILAQVEPTTYPTLYMDCPHGLDLIGAERRQFGFDHAAVTARLLRRWKFPETAVQATANHESFSPERPVLDHAVYAGSLLAEVLWKPGTPPQGHGHMADLRRVLEDIFDTDVDGLISLAEACRTEFRQSAELFRVNVKGDIDVKAIRREAQRLYQDTAMDAVIHLDSLEGILEPNDE
jgi:HD-like signal output (HDOD) protein